ncbi:DUF3784 domain-containing protein [Bacillus shivajii]|uniref:DUF3784 domain-containing protein n=1 Tax=Bacillus shivajii TaxID=1983719 RepID=UPI001CFACA44|nr:DUF3784 domain-containing protein [Bacillus shivajii]UCZ52413.1 DUF3784 domain-containing protein [Bacillus shivajii]
MEQSFIKFITIMIPMVLLFLGGYFILKKEIYDLISGFALKSKEEKRKLINNGYPQAVGRVLINSGIILLIGFILALLSVPFSVEGSFLAVVVYMFTHLLMINKKRSEKNQKRTLLIILGAQFITVSIIAFVMFAAYQSSELSVNEEEIRVSGYYGGKWQVADIRYVEIVDQLPEVKLRAHGFSIGQRAKGRYRLKEVGDAWLFVHKDSPPFILIETENESLYINAKNQTKTKEWFQALKRNVEGE